MPFKGNAIFSSKNAFARLTLSRRDDIISLMYFLAYLIDSDLNWIDFNKPVNSQFEAITKYKIETSAKNFLNKKTMMLLPLVKYAYALNFDEKPDYERIKFMFRKILIKRDFLPDRIFDWSLRSGMQFSRLNHNENHSSISSCSIGSRENTEEGNAFEILRENIKK